MTCQVVVKIGVSLEIDRKIICFAESLARFDFDPKTEINCLKMSGSRLFTRSSQQAVNFSFSTEMGILKENAWELRRSKSSFLEFMFSESC